jgi:hypothetical protein
MPTRQHLSARLPGGNVSTTRSSDREPLSLEYSWIAVRSPDSRRIAHLPPGVGFSVMLAGVLTGMVPPIPGPEDVLIVAFGALALWRSGFRACERWTHRSFPRAHRAGTNVILRYLDDLERRYPGAVPQETFLRRPLERVEIALDEGPPVSPRRQVSSSVTQFTAASFAGP